MSQTTEKHCFLPSEGFARLPQVLAVMSCSKDLWYAGIREGRFPRPVKLGPRASAWRVEDIRKLIKDMGKQVEGQ